MKIAVCLKEVIDTTLKLGYGQIGETLFQKGLSYKLNPQDARALSEALEIKAKTADAEIILISLGPERVEKHLRNALALGADKAIRVWEEGFQYLSSYQKSRLLAAAIAVEKADLVLTGTHSVDNGSGLVGPLMAAWLKIPCVGEVMGLQLSEDSSSVAATRHFARGIQEKTQVTLPALLAICENAGSLPYASLDGILASLGAPIACLTTVDLGITPDDLKNDPTWVKGISFPRPKTKPAPLDSTLPAYDRILALLMGGIAKRRGEILSGNTDEIANRLLERLLKDKESQG